MGTTDRQPDLCSNCGEPLEPHDGDPEDRPRCPECGSTSRTVRVSATGVARASGDATLMVTKVREWIETNWLPLLAAAVLSAAGYLLGGWVGLLVGAAALPVGVGAFTKIREINRR